MNIIECEKTVNPNSDMLTYNGRIDFSETQAPIFVFPGSSVTMLFYGSILKVFIKNNHHYYDNYIGYIMDGVEGRVLLLNDDKLQEIILGEELQEDKLHEITLFKRQDGCHEFTFYGFIISKDGSVVIPRKKPKLCIEFYGETAAAGELVEAGEYNTQMKYNGESSNVWHSYAMITAKNLKAQVSIIAQSGIAFKDNCGYFLAPNCIGMESIYDKLHFNPNLGQVSCWNFKEYIPQVVVIDLGQNDAVPEDFMKNDRNGTKAAKWKSRYKEFVLNIREKYPNAYIILTTNVIKHHQSWDRAIGAVCRQISDEKIVHFLYSNNGRAVPCYVNSQWSEQMAFELSLFIKKLISNT